MVMQKGGFEFQIVLLGSWKGGGDDGVAGRVIEGVKQNCKSQTIK
jgi:hypothetical protein